MTPIQTSKTPGLSRRKVLKALTFGGLVMAAAGPLSMTKVWGWLTETPPLAFSAKASGQVHLKAATIEEGTGLGKGKGKLGMNGHRKRAANNMANHRKASV